MKSRKGRTHRKRRKTKSELKTDLKPSVQISLNYNSLCKWMGEKNFKPAKALQPKDFKDTGRGLMNKESIKSGDLILAIPENLLVTPEFVLKSEIGPYFIEFGPNASGQQILSVFLMFHKTLGSASDWCPYIKSLPDSYSIPAFYGHICLNVLPSLLYEPSLKQIKAVEESYNELIPLIRTIEREMPSVHGLLSEDLYRWAWCTVNTRCVYMECFREDCVGKACSYHLALAPFLDLLNHSTEVQVQAGYNKERKQYEIVSLYDLKRYSQVFISYGCHDNWTLFLEYGFVISNNINDCISFTRDDILTAYQQCKFSPHALAKKLKFLSDKELFRKLTCSYDGLSWNLVIILRILSSNHDSKWWKLILSDNLEFTPEDLVNFKKLQKTILSVKQNQIQTHKTETDCSFKDSYFINNVFQLLLIADKLLINALKS